MDNSRRRFPSNKKKPPQKQQNFSRYILSWILIFFVGITLYNYFSLQFGAGAVKKLDYSEFYRLVSNKETAAKISWIKKTDNLIQGEFNKDLGGQKFKVFVPSEDKDLIPLLRNNVRNFSIEPPKTMLANIIMYFAPTLLFILFIWYFAYRGSQMGTKLWSFGKMKMQNIEKDKTRVTFQDVAGVEEAKEELQEVIAFLKNPRKFQSLGGRIPKGVLLVGPPGCGKTLLAKAVAGEAEVPFFSISGSDFVEMFVGVGASRVRDLFEQSKKAAKTSGRGCIVFIDEIDAVGRQRFAGIGGGHDEREQTLNQLLVEMDGFQPNEGIIVVAATNRPDVLDPALLRPGRFDRHIVVDRPDIAGREAILKVHTRKIKLDENVNLNVIAKQTPGFSGADLENLCNEAALLAARKNKKSVGMEELQESIERVVAGPQRKSRVISKKEKEIVAYHESGHALLALLLPGVDPLHKVSIIPRGIAALGYTMQLPEQDRYILTKSELETRIVVLLGGRAAEELAYHEVSTGAKNDLEVATDMARKMVTEYGMSERIGHITLGRKEGPVFLGRDLVEHKNYSDDTAQLIDSEVKRIVNDAYTKAKTILTENIVKLNLLKDKLLEKEVLTSEEVKEAIGLQENQKSGSSKDIPKEETGKDNSDANNPA